MILPQTKGHIYLYENFIRPTLQKHEGDIDMVLSDAQENVRKRGSKFGIKALASIRGIAFDTLIKGSHFLAEGHLMENAKAVLSSAILTNNGVATIQETEAIKSPTSPISPIISPTSPRAKSSPKGRKRKTVRKKDVSVENNEIKEEKTIDEGGGNTWNFVSLPLDKIRTKYAEAHERHKELQKNDKKKNGGGGWSLEQAMNNNDKDSNLIDSINSDDYLN
jgi:hypothetical protein